MEASAVRGRFATKARRNARAGDWRGAYKYFEWLRGGRGNDLERCLSRVGATTAGEQWAEQHLAAARWQEATTLEPHAEQRRRAMEGNLGL